MMPVFPSSSSPIRFDDHVTTELSGTSEHNKLNEVDNSNNSDREHTTREINELSDQVISDTK